MRAPRPLLAQLALLALAACGGPPHPRPVLGEVPKVVEVALEGVKRFSKAELLDHLHLGETRWLPLTPDHYLHEALLPADRARIEALYAAYGYPSARVLALQVEPVAPGEVRVRVSVEEGPVTRVERVSFDWAADTGLDPAARAALAAALPLRAGDPFEVARFNDSLGQLRLQLQAWGYPHARATGSATLHPGGGARVRFAVDPGAYARVGEVRLEGLDAVPRAAVARELRFAVGAQFSPGLLAAVAHAARGMDVFRWVAPQPGPTVEDGQVALVVKLSEADPQSLRLGVRGVFEAARWEQQVQAKYTHTNLFSRLLRLDLSLEGGWAQLPDPFRPEAHGPVLGLEPRLSHKGWLEDHLLWSLRPRLDVDIQPGYQILQPSGAVGVARWFGRWLRGDLSYNLAFADFFNIRPALDTATTPLGLDFRDPYLISWLRAVLDAPLVDNLQDPRNGAILRLTYELAGGALGGDFDYHKVTASWRGFWRAARWLQLAARLETGLIKGFGDRPGAPLDRKLYLGGANTIRAWGARQLAPRLPEDPAVPAGGQTLALGNLELRVPVAGALSVVGFLDVGDVQAEALTYRPEAWNYTAGPGLRYASPVGLVRLDAGFRLNDPGIYQDVPGFAVHFGFGEAF